MDAPAPTGPRRPRSGRGRLDLHDLEVPEVSVLPFAIGSFQTIGPLALADFPHRHTFYEIVLVTGGSGHHVVDLHPWPITPPHLGVIVPGQIHHWQRARGVEGSVLLFNEDFLRRHPEDAAVLHVLGALAWLRPDPDQMEGLTELAAQMQRELCRADPGYESVLRAYLHILIVRAARIADALGPAAPTADGPATKVSGLVDRYLRLITAPRQGGRTLTSYAREIGVSPGHLHELVREQTGLTPGKLTRRHRILEAKRLLAGTDLTVRQVSEQTGFHDPSYFCRFFRRETGLTPGEFRRRATGMHHDPLV
ncbi:AraC family transcriptional regulator [Catenulispora subtropica]|uniref:AraC family transcriptional regulator n=1 Tax=Catenulispora subtropica TaxID=450798 RepID=A0ABP5CV12_9ACTN